ncbi:hypothetical protein [Legionella sp. CNM-4043-24]|uniref:hypothetical protein n=1 Tax=Legionella sp. CNM-4043-24 TaxID=3421646 RepID=UPI00403B1310
MRLTSQQIEDLIRAITPYLDKMSAELRLYGSRVDDTCRGGDIDLLLLLDSPEHAMALKSEKHYILASIKKYLGDQKIDLLITSRGIETDATFLNIIYPKSILLTQVMPHGRSGH